MTTRLTDKALQILKDNGYRVVPIIGDLYDVGEKPRKLWYHKTIIVPCGCKLFRTGSTNNTIWKESNDLCNRHKEEEE